MVGDLLAKQKYGSEYREDCGQAHGGQMVAEAFDRLK